MLLAYLCLSFTIQAWLFSGQLTRNELHHTLSLPKILAPRAIQLCPCDNRELVLEVLLPNILFGIQIFWELQLCDEQTQHVIRLRYRLRSGHNRLRLVLDDPSQAALFAQFRPGFYRSDKQSFFLRDSFSFLQMRYCIKWPLELSILSPGRTLHSTQDLSAADSHDPLRMAIQKFALEGFNEQRPYYPGDDPRRINWKLYSRFDELYVRIPEEQPVHSQNLHCYFLLDMTCYPKQPKVLRSNVLNTAATYFLSKLKELHHSGYRMVVHLPTLHNPQNLIYEETNEESILKALSSYPLAYSYEENFLRQLLQAERSGTHLIFCSPHSLLASGVETLQAYFPTKQSFFLPVPEPSAPLAEDLLQKSVLRLLPLSSLSRWLLYSKHSPRFSNSPLRQLAQQLGTPDSHCSQISYPQLLLRLFAWQSYYRKPEKRYPQ